MHAVPLGNAASLASLDAQRHALPGLVVGDRVVGAWGPGSYYCATVRRLEEDGSLRLGYDDGDSGSLPRSRVFCPRVGDEPPPGARFPFTPELVQDGVVRLPPPHATKLELGYIMRFFRSGVAEKVPIAEGMRALLRMEGGGRLGRGREFAVGSVVGEDAPGGLRVVRVRLADGEVVRAERRQVWVDGDLPAIPFPEFVDDAGSVVVGERMPHAVGSMTDRELSHRGMLGELEAGTRAIVLYAGSTLFQATVRPEADGDGYHAVFDDGDSTSHNPRHHILAHGDPYPIPLPRHLHPHHLPPALHIPPRSTPPTTFLLPFPPPQHPKTTLRDLRPLQRIAVFTPPSALGFAIVVEVNPERNTVRVLHDDDKGETGVSLERVLTEGAKLAPEPEESEESDKKIDKIDETDETERGGGEAGGGGGGEVGVEEEEEEEVRGKNVLPL